MYTRTGTYHSPAFLEPKTLENNTRYPKVRLVYSAFGAPLAGRTFSSPSYKYGFNGKEKDGEMYGSDGSSYDFGARMYDARVGRFLSVDPKASKNSELSTYSYAANSPLVLIDYDGEEYRVYGSEENVNAYIKVLQSQLGSDYSVQIVYHKGEATTSKDENGNPVTTVTSDYYTVNFIHNPSDPSKTPDPAKH
ncbi:MAG: hypothetical protein MUC87_14375 [Bacteroidia bacterium]|nr:hypothetical protein [Bacteroidia bacterium]